MSKKPLIGITLDSQESGGYAAYPWYALRENYCSMITQAGGVPFPLTHDLGLIDAYMSYIDGLLITGGGFDINPALYGAQTTHPSVTLNPQRTAFEMAMTKAALEKNIPVLGICGGLQVINVLLGGTLIQHIPDEVPECLQHQQTRPRHETSHTIKISKGSLLHKIVGTDEIEVNSTHHQAIRGPGQGVVVSAIAPDGVIEGIEVPIYRFCLGVQWHPEYLTTPHDRNMAMAFLEASRGER